MMRVYGLVRRAYRKVFDEDGCWEMEKIELKRPRDAAGYLQAVKAMG